MSCIVPWNGRDYDIDPLDLSGLELKEIKLRAGFTFKELIPAVGNLDADAVRALFWAVERRGNADLKFSDYEGPTMRTFLPHLPAWIANLTEGEVGKALGLTAESGETSETSGSPSSPTDSDGPDASTTS